MCSRRDYGMSMSRNRTFTTTAFFIALGGAVRRIFVESEVEITVPQINWSIVLRVALIVGMVIALTVIAVMEERERRN